LTAVLKGLGGIPRPGLNDLLIEFLCRGTGRVCKKCGGADQLQVDHIVPLSFGGPNKMENLQVLCKVCHDQKTKAETVERRTRSTPFQKRVPL